MIERSSITVGDIVVDIVRKDIKFLHLGVYPPHGRVRIAAPLRLDDEAVRLAVVTRLHWIRRQQRHFADQERQSERAMVTGESHWVAGRRYRLLLVEQPGPSRMQLLNNTTLELRVPPDTTRDQREAVLLRWYRRRLRGALGVTLAHWQPRVGVDVAAWGIRKMKTRWGTCDTTQRRLWFNLELAKKPPSCLEYLVVHELVHLLERHHNERFSLLMSGFLPDWRLRRDELNRAPLGHDDWDY